MASDFEKHTQEIYAALNAHDLDKFLSLHSDDIVVTLQDGSSLRGQKEVRNYFVAAFSGLSNLKAELNSCITSGSKQCEEYILSGRHTGDFLGVPATGKDLSIRTVAIREMKGGKTSQVSSYLDGASVMRQMGILP